MPPRTRGRRGVVVRESRGGWRRARRCVCLVTDPTSRLLIFVTSDGALVQPAPALSLRTPEQNEPEWRPESARSGSARHSTTARRRPSARWPRRSRVPPRRSTPRRTAPRSCATSWTTSSSGARFPTAFRTRRIWNPTAWTSPRCSRPFASPGATGPARRDGKHRGSAERGGRVERDRDERRFRLPPVVSFASLGIAIPSLAVKPGAAAPAPPSAADAVAPTPRRSLSLVMPLSRGVSLDAAGREAPDASGTASRQADADADAAGVAAPIPDLILPPLRGGGPFGDSRRERVYRARRGDRVSESGFRKDEQTDERRGGAVCVRGAGRVRRRSPRARRRRRPRRAGDLSGGGGGVPGAARRRVHGTRTRRPSRARPRACTCGSRRRRAGAAPPTRRSPARRSATRRTQPPRARAAFARRQLAAVTETRGGARATPRSPARGALGTPL